MRALLDFYPGDQTAVLMLNVAVQIAGVVLLAWMLSRLLARRNPAAHYVIWLCALACVSVGPLAAWAFQRTQWSLVRLPLLPPEEKAVASPPPGEEADTTFASLAATGTLDGSANGPGEGSPLSPGYHAAATVPAEPLMSWADRVRAALGGLVFVWICGAAVLIARLAWGWRLLIVLRRELVPLDLRNLGDVPDQVRRALGVGVLPPMATCDRLGSPISLGIFRRVVVLPTTLVWRLDAPQLRDVLVHECAHIVRRDHAVGLLQRLLHVVFWPHPLIYLLGRELARAREEVCDNFVIKAGDVVGYARTLLRLSEGSSPARSAMAAIGILQPRCPLEGRVAGLLDTRRRLVTQISRLVLLPVVLAFLAAVAIVAGTRIVAAVAEEAEDDSAEAAQTADTSELMHNDRANEQPEDDRGLVPAADLAIGTVRQEQSAVSHESSLGLMLAYAREGFDRGLQRIRSWNASRRTMTALRKLGEVPLPLLAAESATRPEAGGNDALDTTEQVAQHRPAAVPSEQTPRPWQTPGSGSVPVAGGRFEPALPTVEAGVVPIPTPIVEETDPLWSMVRVDDQYSVSRVTARSKPLDWQTLELVTVAGLDWSFSEAHDTNRLFVGLYVTNVGGEPVEFDPAAVRLVFRCGRAQPVPVEMDYTGVDGLEPVVILPGQSQLVMVKNVRIESFEGPKYLALVGEGPDGRAFELPVPREKRYGVSFQYRLGAEPWPISPELECRLVEPEQ